MDRSLRKYERGSFNWHYSRDSNFDEDDFDIYYGPYFNCYNSFKRYSRRYPNRKPKHQERKLEKNDSDWKKLNEKFEDHMTDYSNITPDNSTNDIDNKTDKLHIQIDEDSFSLHIDTGSSFLSPNTVELCDKNFIIENDDFKVDLTGEDDEDVVTTTGTNDGKENAQIDLEKNMKKENIPTSNCNNNMNNKPDDNKQSNNVNKHESLPESNRNDSKRMCMTISDYNKFCQENIIKNKSIIQDDELLGPHIITKPLLCTANINKIADIEQNVCVDNKNIEQNNKKTHINNNPVDIEKSKHKMYHHSKGNTSTKSPTSNTTLPTTSSTVNHKNVDKRRLSLDECLSKTSTSLNNKITKVSRPNKNSNINATSADNNKLLVERKATDTTVTTKHDTSSVPPVHQEKPMIQKDVANILRNLKDERILRIMSENYDIPDDIIKDSQTSSCSNKKDTTSSEITNTQQDLCKQTKGQVAATTSACIKDKIPSEYSSNKTNNKDLVKWGTDEKSSCSNKKETSSEITNTQQDLCKQTKGQVVATTSALTKDKIPSEYSSNKTNNKDLVKWGTDEKSSCSNKKETSSEITNTQQDLCKQTKGQVVATTSALTKDKIPSEYSSNKTNNKDLVKWGTDEKSSCSNKKEITSSEITNTQQDLCKQTKGQVVATTSACTKDKIPSEYPSNKTNNKDLVKWGTDEKLIKKHPVVKLVKLTSSMITKNKMLGIKRHNSEKIIVKDKKKLKLDIDKKSKTSSQHAVNSSISSNWYIRDSHSSDTTIVLSTSEHSTTRIESDPERQTNKQLAQKNEDSTVAQTSSASDMELLKYYRKKKRRTSSEHKDKRKTKKTDSTHVSKSPETQDDYLKKKVVQIENHPIPWDQGLRNPTKLLDKNTRNKLPEMKLTSSNNSLNRTVPVQQRDTCIKSVLSSNGAATINCSDIEKEIAVLFENNDVKQQNNALNILPESNRRKSISKVPLSTEEAQLTRTKDITHTKNPIECEIDEAPNTIFYKRDNNNIITNSFENLYKRKLNENNIQATNKLENNTTNSLECTSNNSNALNFRPVVQVICPPVVQDICPPVAQEICHPIAQNICLPVAQDICPPMAQEICHPMAQNICPPVAQNIYPPVTQNICPPVTQVICPPRTQDICPPVAQVICPPVAQDICPPVTQICSPVAQDICPPVTQDICPPVAQVICPPVAADKSTEPLNKQNLENGKIVQSTISNSLERIADNFNNVRDSHPVVQDICHPVDHNKNSESVNKQNLVNNRIVENNQPINLDLWTRSEINSGTEFVQNNSNNNKSDVNVPHSQLESNVSSEKVVNDNPIMEFVVEEQSNLNTTDSLKTVDAENSDVCHSEQQVSSSSEISTTSNQQQSSTNSTNIVSTSLHSPIVTTCSNNENTSDTNEKESIETKVKIKEDDENVIDLTEDFIKVEKSEIIEISDDTSPHVRVKSFSTLSFSENDKMIGIFFINIISYTRNYEDRLKHLPLVQRMQEHCHYHNYLMSRVDNNILNILLESMKDFTQPSTYERFAAISNNLHGYIEKKFLKKEVEYVIGYLLKTMPALQNEFMRVSNVPPTNSTQSTEQFSSSSNEFTIQSPSVNSSNFPPPLHSSYNTQHQSFYNNNTTIPPAYNTFPSNQNVISNNPQNPDVYNMPSGDYVQAPPPAYNVNRNDMSNVVPNQQIFPSYPNENNVQIHFQQPNNNVMPPPSASSNQMYHQNNVNSQNNTNLQFMSKYPNTVNNTSREYSNNQRRQIDALQQQHNNHNIHHNVSSRETHSNTTQNIPNTPNTVNNTIANRCYANAMPPPNNPQISHGRDNIRRSAEMHVSNNEYVNSQMDATTDPRPRHTVHHVPTAPSRAPSVATYNNLSTNLNYNVSQMESQTLVPPPTYAQTLPFLPQSNQTGGIVAAKKPSVRRTYSRRNSKNSTSQVQQETIPSQQPSSNMSNATNLHQQQSTPAPLQNIHLRRALLDTNNDIPPGLTGNHSNNSTTATSLASTPGINSSSQIPESHLPYLNSFVQSFVHPMAAALPHEYMQNQRK